MEMHDQPQAAGLSGPAPDETVTPVFRHAIPNVASRDLVAVEVRYPPGGASLAHRHAPSAFIFAYVLSGEVRSQVDDQPPRTYRAGESFYEVPGSRHLESRNASPDHPASMLAVFVVDPDDQELTIVTTAS